MNVLNMMQNEPFPTSVEEMPKEFVSSKKEPNVRRFPFYALFDGGGAYADYRRKIDHPLDVDALMRFWRERAEPAFVTSLVWAPASNASAHRHDMRTHHSRRHVERASRGGEVQ